VVVGAGGAGANDDDGDPTGFPGNNSSFGADPTLVAIGGGGGYSSIPQDPTSASTTNGGSGGGGASILTFPGLCVNSMSVGLVDAIDLKYSLLSSSYHCTKIQEQGTLAARSSLQVVPPCDHVCNYIATEYIQF
jgi:hypothetical protein